MFHRRTIQVNDDGTRAFTDFDESAASAVASVVDRFDALGRKSSETTTWDDATRLVVDYDQDGTKIWSEARTLYDALDRKDEQTIAYDTGKTVATDYDEASVHAWATLALTTDALGREDLAVQVNDDGSKVTRDLDQADTAAWAEKITTTDALSRVTETYVKSDDSTSRDTRTDVADIHDWAIEVILADAQARGTSRATTFDDGSRQVTRSDTTGDRFWTAISTHVGLDNDSVTVAYEMRNGARLVLTGNASDTGADQVFLLAPAGGFPETIPTTPAPSLQPDPGTSSGSGIWSTVARLARLGLGVSIALDAFFSDTGNIPDTAHERAMLDEELARMAASLPDSPTTAPTDPNTGTVPAGVPAGSELRFADRDGTSFYQSNDGNLWAVDADGNVAPASALPDGISGDASWGGPGSWAPSNETFSDDSWLYQEQVTGVSALFAYWVGGKKFDSYDRAAGELIDAKYNHLQFYDANGQPKEWYRASGGFNADTIGKMLEQLEVAGNNKVVWVVAEEGYATILNNLISDDSRLSAARQEGRLEIRHQPPRPQP